LKTFAELGVAEVYIKALTENKIFIPSEIQEKSIPFLIEKGIDFIGQAQTGTGKTAAFVLPLLHRIDAKSDKVQALILVPTRELGQQIAKEIFKFTKHSDKIFTEAVYGGSYIGKQISALQRPTQIVVATPGRLIDLLDKKALTLSYVKTIILDEADEMLSMGFKEELDNILERTQGSRFTWLFSATMPHDIKNIIKNYMSPNPFKVQIGVQEIINKSIEHKFIICEKDEKMRVLINFLKSQGENRGIIFCRTKENAQNLALELKAKKILADSLHGDLQQLERDKVMRAFKNKNTQILVATDIAARGLDIESLAYVVHYQLPDHIDYFTHRSGRTARAGKTGLSLAMITRNELEKIKSYERALNIVIGKY